MESSTDEVPNTDAVHTVLLATDDSPEVVASTETEPIAPNTAETHANEAAANPASTCAPQPLPVPVLEAASAEILESLHTLLQRFDQLDGRLDGWVVGTPPYSGSADPSQAEQSVASDAQAIDELHDDLRHLQATLDDAWRANEELRHQNETLAAQVAQSSVRQTVQTGRGCDESLSWEDRKKLIMRQMEEDSFDADTFINSLSSTARSQIDALNDSKPAGSEPLSAQELVQQLIENLQRAEQTIRNRDSELGELRMLLDNQSQTRADGTAIGAAAIASMIDSDALVMEERERLQQLKNDWEDKFRKAEIEASLERAKLSRERQEVAKRAQELEEKLDELQREKRDQMPHPKPGRRWLAELGLANDAG